jgi:hypothetical protein
MSFGHRECLASSAARSMPSCANTIDKHGPGLEETG